MGTEDSTASREPGIALSDFLAFNTKLEKLIAAGVPIRFPGAPVRMREWLQDVSRKVALRVSTGAEVLSAVDLEVGAQGGYRDAFVAWCGTQQRGDYEQGEGDLSVLEPWVVRGVQGDRRVQESWVSLVSLWILGAIAILTFWVTVQNLYPSMAFYYENARLVPGFGFQALSWLNRNLSWLVAAASLVWVAFAWLGRGFVSNAFRHVPISKRVPGFWLGVAVLVGGVIVAALGLMVFWPLIELLHRVSEPSRI